MPRNVGTSVWGALARMIPSLFAAVVGVILVSSASVSISRSVGLLFVEVALILLSIVFWART